ncbi:MAG: hypothetical protein CL916_00905 [Deltaproteobacteria bacterium]|nr:hypothetical protein [Deltaproteobacteria bacterium]
MIFILLACSDDVQVEEHDSLLRPATWSANDIQSAFDEVMEYGLPDPNDFWLLYQELYDEGATPSCPGTDYNFDGQELTAYDCFTSDGFRFEGLSEFMYELGGWRLHLEGRIIAPDGRIVHGAGSVAIEETDIMRKTFEGTLYSNFGADWLTHTPSLLLYLEKFDGTYIIDGGYTIEGNSISFNRFRIGDCPYGEGEILLREPQGGWWTYRVEQGCSDTGALSFHNEKIADISLNIDALVQEMERVLP